mgnify:CR=1 FL=1
MLPKGYISLAIYSAVIIISGMTNAIIYVIPPPGILESVLSKRVKCLLCFLDVLVELSLSEFKILTPCLVIGYILPKYKNTVNNIS